MAREVEMRRDGESMGNWELEGSLESVGQAWMRDTSTNKATDLI